VPLDSLNLAEPGLMERVVELFHRRHEQLYTYSMRDQEVLLVNARVAVVGKLPELPKEPEILARPRVRPVGRRRVYLGKWREVPVFNMEALAPAQTIGGPAIVEAATTTVLLRDSDRAGVTPLGWLDIRVAAAHSPGPPGA
jgi:N-methylhydantoinase A